MQGVKLDTNTFKMIERYYSLLWDKEVDIKEIIRHFYVTEGLSLRGVADEILVSPTTVHSIVRQFGLKQNVTWK